MEWWELPRLYLRARLVFRENAFTKFVLVEPPSIASASSGTGNREDMHEVCHLRSTDRRRTQARSAATASEILLEVPGGAAAPCKSKVHLAAGARRLSQSTLFRRAESSLPSPHLHGSHDRIAALVHQAAGRTVGPDDEDGPAALDRGGVGSSGEPGGPRVISNNRETVAPSGKIRRQQVEAIGHLPARSRRLHDAGA